MDKTLKLVIGAVTILCLSIFFAASASSKQYSRQEMIEKSAACFDCHSEQVTSLAGTPHQIGAATDLKSPVTVGCIGCHDGWEKHLEGPSTENIKKPSNASQADQAEICGRCHVTTHQQAMVSTDPHVRGNVTCLTCHSIHGNKTAKLTKDGDDNYCASCHTNVMLEFKRRSAHPLNSGNIRCTSCHALSSIKDKTLAVGIDWTCQNCHSDKSGPFPYEHPVVNNHLVNGGGCTECHQPHGSNNDRLLNEPDRRLCQQCHSTPPGHFTNHDGLGSKLECQNCHSDIHGSFDNRKLLDPNLGTRYFPDCFQSGCHIFGN